MITFVVKLHLFQAYLQRKTIQKETLKTMKSKLILLLLFAQSFYTNGQSIEINQITPTAVEGGINVNLLVTTYNMADYLSHEYSVEGNTINLTVCYWFTLLLPVYQIENDFFINVPNNETYTIQVNIVHSSSDVTCDYYANGPSSSVTYLDNEKFEKPLHQYSIYPNPSNGIITFSGDESKVKTIKIYDNFGRLVKQLNNNFTNSIAVHELIDGIYFILFETEIGNLNQKLVIRK